MIKAGIIGVTGYTGATLLGILLKHPEIHVEWITSRSYAGKKIAEVYPHLNGLTDLVCKKPNLFLLPKDTDVVFICLPHGLSMEIVPKFLKQDTKIIDLGADYRLKKEADYKNWYKFSHKNPKLLKESIYGLPEIHKLELLEADLVANPGCYATASILSLYPLIKDGIIEKDGIIIDAKSGVSGAGRALSLTTHFTECNEGLSAYKVTTHRHTPEIEQELNGKITFVPHLIPMDRGILVTAYAKLKKNAPAINHLKKFYKDKPFVRVLENSLPNTKNVRGTNFCDIAVVEHMKKKEVIVITAIDNLMKGASSQAVQNMNIMFGLDEHAGINNIALFP